MFKEAMGIIAMFGHKIATIILLGLTTLLFCFCVFVAKFGLEKYFIVSCVVTFLVAFAYCIREQKIMSLLYQLHDLKQHEHIHLSTTVSGTIKFQIETIGNQAIKLWGESSVQSEGLRRVLHKIDATGATWEELREEMIKCFYVEKETDLDFIIDRAVFLSEDIPQRNRRRRFS